jgi:hypothetical protein
LRVVIGHTVADRLWTDDWCFDYGFVPTCNVIRQHY